MIRACVIGLGPIGNRHSGLLKADPLAELVGVCDLIPERADAASLFDRVDAFKRGFFLEGGSGTAASVEFCS